MVADIEHYRSHPGRSLFEHLDSVRDNVKNKTDLPVAEFAAIFHDVGKLNPNFQNKLNGIENGYSSHAYLSAFIFYIFCQLNQQKLCSKYNLKEIEEIVAVIDIIAHHHGNLSNFDQILSEKECDKLFAFLNMCPHLPVNKFLHKFFTTEDIEKKLNNERFWEGFKLTGYEPKNPLKTFLETQYAFASLIMADKKDASEHRKYFSYTNDFFKNYSASLTQFIKKFKDDSELNIIRTNMRTEAETKIIFGLKKDRRLFSLTAPTGAGKTIMLLSVADKIRKERNVQRILYVLPFLSITEQVEDICNEIFGNDNSGIRRIDSKADNNNYQSLQADVENSPEQIKTLIAEHYSEDFFDYPFIITTFVKFFETILSNKNASLLKLPNFANSIFLIDEIQALPPRLYGFFIALLDAFCKRFNSYAIVSSATMPDFRLPGDKKPILKEIFKEYEEPLPLLDLSYFSEKPFNRYDVITIKNLVKIEDLANRIVDQKESVLVILNTIQDSLDLFKLLENCKREFEIDLLNTRFIPDDRKKKIENAKNKLIKNERIILITTQLIEAGVDIDFPVVIRDISPLSNIVQSAGRCNRNNKLRNKGKVIIVTLEKNGFKRAEFIYRGKDKILLDYIEKSILNEETEESELLEKQLNFFKYINDTTIFGMHYSNDKKIDLVEKIKNVEFEETGKFKLIDEKMYGEEYRYYIAKDYKDSKFEELQALIEGLKSIEYSDFEKRKLFKINIEQKLKSMSGRIVQIRLRKDESPPLASTEICYGIQKLELNYYYKTTGVRVASDNQII